MALLTTARILRRAQPQHILLSLLRAIKPQPPPLLSSSQLICQFSSGFHQTDLTRSLTLPRSSYFSTIQQLLYQTLCDPIDFNQGPEENYKQLELGVLELLKRVKDCRSVGEAMALIDSSNIKPTGDLICSAIWALRDDWKVAFLVLKWGEKWGCVSEKACSLMIWVLGNHGKFNVAWCLIRDLHGSLADTQPAMLTMMDRYAAANNPGRAIRTFHLMEKFRLSHDAKVFYSLLNILCRHGNVEEAEDCMLQNKKFFPLEIEGFNIILNGWCNISVDIFEAKRVWREMSKCCITPNATSYTHMISCFSKVGNLFDSLRLYDEMKKRGWVPGLEVYNSLVYILSRENCLNEAYKILEKMKDIGFQPSSATYNSMIRPLCESKKLEEARTVLAIMIGENIGPTIETYHAFLENASFEGTLEVLNRMRRAGPRPNGDTFLLILGKFFKSKQPDNALKIWAQMKEFEVIINLAHYATLIQGLAICGLLDKAREFHTEMISNGFMDDPKLRALLTRSLQGKKGRRNGQTKHVKGVSRVHHRKANVMKGKKHGSQSRQKTSFEKS